MISSCRMLQVVSVLALFLFGIRATKGDKDGSYYVLGTGNPNIYESMYWKDADNILEDLNQFSALYVRFHQCAWTWNQRSNDEDEGVEENDYWYMGKIPPMAANVAFSLYGHVSGKGSFKGCNQDTFINSFYTTTGFTAFVTAMRYTGVSGFSYSSSSYSSECQGGYGVGCDSSGGFAMHQYSSSICDPQNVTKTTNTLSSLNKAMQNVQCTMIYNKARSYSSSSYGNGDDADDDGSGSRSGTSLALLDNSAACFYQNVFSPDGTCPDPYGKIAYYKQNFYKEILKAKKQRPANIYRQQALYTSKIQRGQSHVKTGAILIALAGVVLLLDKLTFECIVPMFSKRARARKARTTTKDDEQSTTTTDSDVEDPRYM